VLAFIHDRTEKGEEGMCPTCRKGPVKVGIFIQLTSRFPLTIFQPDDLLEVIKRKKVKPAEIGIAPERDEDEDVNAPPPSSPAYELRKNDFKSSTKLNALIAHLRMCLWIVYME
jgi:DNA repair protein RAD5